MHMFKSKLICGACVTMFIHGWIFMVQMFYIPTLYQLIYGYSAAEAGLLLLPVTLAQRTPSSIFARSLEASTDFRSFLWLHLWCDHKLDRSVQGSRPQLCSWPGLRLNADRKACALGGRCGPWVLASSPLSRRVQTWLHVSGMPL